MGAEADTETPQQTSERARGGSHFSWILWVVATLMFYVLSTGPVIKLVRTGRLPDGVRLIYAPLELLVNNSPVAATFFRWYVWDLWNNSTGIPFVKG